MEYITSLTKLLCIYEKRERSVNFYEISIQTVAATKVNFEPTQSTFLEIFVKLIPLIKTKSTFGSAKNSVELVDLKFNKVTKQLFLLFNKVNPDLPEIGLFKATTKSRRKPQKDSDEEREQSSHVLITPLLNTNKARVLITTGSGIGPVYIKRLLSETYRKNKETATLLEERKRHWPTRRIDNDGSSKTYLVNHSFQVTSEPSESLSNILNNQVVAEIDMVDNRDLTIDGTSLKVEKRTYTLTGNAIPKTVTGLKGVIQKAMDQFKIDIDHLRIVYEEDEGADAAEAVSQESEMHIDTQKKIKKSKSLNYSQLDQLFTRSDKIVLSTDHAETQTNLSPEICNKLLKL